MKLVTWALRSISISCFCCSAASVSAFFSSSVCNQGQDVRVLRFSLHKAASASIINPLFPSGGAFS